MLKNIKLVIFDLDGTLIDAYPAIIDSFNFTMRKLRLPSQDDLTIRRAVGWGIEGLFVPFVGKELLKKTIAIYRKHHRKSLVSKSKLFPGVRGLLEGLRKKGLILAVASNRPSDTAFVILDCLDIGKYFEYILCGDHIKRLKPSPDILRKVLKKFSLKPLQALYVGDMTVDVITGNRAGVKTVAVPTGSSTKEEIIELKPFKIIKRVSQVANIV